MDDQTLNQSLKQTLTDRAQSAIPDDYDRWSHIQDALSQEDPMKLHSLRVAPTNPRRVHRLIFVIAAALLLTTTAVYAVYQVFPQPIDPGAEGIQEEGYTTPLNLVQRDGDVEVQLNWGYIDSGRTLLNYQIFTINPDGTRNEDHHYILTKALLKNMDGVLEERSPSMDSAGSVPPPTPRIGTLTYNYSRKFDPSSMPNTMTLQLEIQAAEGKFSTVRGAQAILRSLIPIGVWRPATPLDGYLYEWPEPYILPGPESTAEPAFKTTAPMVFEFTLPVQRAVLMQPQQSVDANGVVATLNLISSAPSRTKVSLCFTVPPSESAWSPNMTITLDGELRGPSMAISQAPDENGQSCSEIDFNIFTAPDMTLNIRVERITRVLTYQESTDLQYMLKLQQDFAARGIEIEVEQDAKGGVGMHSFPSGGTPKERAAMIELGYMLEGPWEFSVQIPPGE